ncbi:NnrS family protein [Thiobacillus sedimenti]|uniref:NnrS family protein n=1 Tax=Thiobacillus sedimenti TaxID=3110231 RepID=A0ABZ1CMM9_9PROT|nr:NnrS family protein [Thiobacillus sp. SCUT-2]WRS40537.1 NnrS family protein [Thiobacillus sp. SCUT-2]
MQPIEDLQARPPLTRWAPFGLGFRPFFLAAGVYAVLLIALWLLVLRGVLHVTELPALVWHGHEMVFGFAVSVIGGFLLTAAQNWTGIRTPSGAPLAGLFALWLAGRAAFLVPGLPPALVAAVDLAFLPVLALSLAVPIARARQLNNAPFPVLLLALTVANALVHAEALHWTGATARTGLHLAVYVIVMMIGVMGGRVIPSFTDNKLQTRARRWTSIERLAPVASLLALAAALVAPDSGVTAALAAFAAAVHGRRLAGWYTPKFWSVPLLWILHLGYAWIVVGFALLALSAAGWNAAAGSALHAFTAGAIGTLTLGMMARVSLGHTGRPLEPPPIMSAAFVAINLAALVRVALPLAFPAAYDAILDLAGLIWIAAFGLFAWVYAPMLLRPRVDGKRG